MRVRKLAEDWRPAENPDLAVGDIIEITDPEWLIKTRKVVAVDEKGNEIPMGGTFNCPICAWISADLDELQAHLGTHKSVKPEEVKPIEVKTEIKEPTLREKRLEALAKARAARAAKRSA